jgi:predicted hydrocarbon binding protein
MGRIMFESMEEVVGRNGLNAVLHLAGLDNLAGPYPPANQEREFSFETISALQEKLEQLYGPRGGRGLAMRVGRSCFKYGLREFGLEMGLTETTFRLMPMSIKLRTAGQAFADLFNLHSDQRVHIEEAEGKLIWYIDRCPLCWGRHENDVVCHLAVGLLQESMYWLSGGKIFDVQETQCIAHGDPACTIVINTVPLD